MPATGESLVGRDRVIAFQRNYPEPWGELRVLRVIGTGAEAAAEVEVVDPAGRRFGMCAFWLQEAGLLLEGVEYWVDLGSPPPEWRRPG